MKQGEDACCPLLHAALDYSICSSSNVHNLFCFDRVSLNVTEDEFSPPTFDVISLRRLTVVSITPDMNQSAWKGFPMFISYRTRLKHRPSERLVCMPYLRYMTSF
ncbi:hypothetical protein Ccrd_012117 [Cynara cardunculus var. scolymus]|uniref:Uncharacterized protein n=1 Tax=Cynara cardunculus var. scolymus TaxID=59895 RepID=A0A118K5R9_CYNCS|nr:hypothetical protein Ccrd_012117 [Cynara cardunculus var. scolymus]